MGLFNKIGELFTGNLNETTEVQVKDWIPNDIPATKEEVAKIVAGGELTQEQIIEAIHNEFMSAGDKLVFEAQERLKEAAERSKVVDKALLKKYTALGLSNDAVRESESLLNQREAKNLEAEKLIRYKASASPYKIIDRDSVMDICKKYNLALGRLSHYKGDIPTKNLDDMLKAQEVFSNKNRSIRGFCFDGQFAETTAIAAPVEDFSGRFTRGNEGTMVQETFTIPDPIVLIPLTESRSPYYDTTHNPHNHDGYFAIATAWGVEASDPLIKDGI